MYKVTSSGVVEQSVMMNGLVVDNTCLGPKSTEVNQQFGDVFSLVNSAQATWKSRVDHPEEYLPIRGRMQSMISKHESPRPARGCRKTGRL